MRLAHTFSVLEIRDLESWMVIAVSACFRHVRASCDGGSARWMEVAMRSGLHTHLPDWGLKALHMRQVDVAC